ncbi:MAG: hypothetical protein HN368_24475 [Spirochaetales bacterium]|nr:hypothetical protein [Spirochaetales bacterium]
MDSIIKRFATVLVLLIFNGPNILGLPNPEVPVSHSNDPFDCLVLSWNLIREKELSGTDPPDLILDSWIGAVAQLRFRDINTIVEIIMRASVDYQIGIRV